MGRGVPWYGTEKQPSGRDVFAATKRPHHYLTVGALEKSSLAIHAFYLLLLCLFQTAALVYFNDSPR